MIEKQPIDTIVPDYIKHTRRRTLFSNEPKERQLGPHGSSSSFVNAQGLRIASYYWPVSPQACRLPTDFMLRYELLAFSVILQSSESK